MSEGHDHRGQSNLAGPDRFVRSAG